MGSNTDFRELLTGTVPFVMARRKETGGFGATPKLPATIEDTYHALRILHLVRLQSAPRATANGLGPDKRLRTFLESRIGVPKAGIRTIFQFLWCRRAAGLSSDPDPVAAAVLNGMRTSVSLEDWYYLARIETEVLCGRSPATRFGQMPYAVLRHQWRSVDEAWMHLFLCRFFRRPPSRTESELIAWFRACQNGDGGFGFYPGTTSFIENCYSSLRALAALGGKPADPERARRFLTCCRTVSGGFGRGLHSAPFLDSTWHGIAALALLG